MKYSEYKTSIESLFSGNDKAYLTEAVQRLPNNKMMTSREGLVSEKAIDYYYQNVQSLPLEFDVPFPPTVNPDFTFMLDYLIQSLVIQRDKKTISMARPRNLSIQGIVNLLDSHFHSSYNASGASRLPVLAIYAIYQCLFAEGGKRYENKKLLPLESHTSADVRSGRLGDIDITDHNNHSFEAVEIKFDIPVTHNIVVNAKEKIQPSSVERYYILSTSPIDKNDRDSILDDINQIKNTHGCQLIVNGVMPTLKYYLRLLDDTTAFIDNYAALLESDTTIKYEHKQQWNQLVSEI